MEKQSLTSWPLAAHQLPPPATSSSSSSLTQVNNTVKRRLTFVAAAAVTFVILRSASSTFAHPASARSGPYRSATAQPRRHGKFGFDSVDADTYRTQLTTFANRILPISNISVDSNSETRLPPLPNATLQDELECYLDSTTALKCDTGIPPYIFATDRIVDPLPPPLQHWQALNPTATLYAWDDEQIAGWIRQTFPNSINKDSVVADLYDKLPLKILRYDLFRLLTLFVHGGTYTDADTVPVKPINQWHHGAKDVLSGTVSPHQDPSLVVAVEWVGKTEHNTHNPRYSRDVGIVQWTFSAAPGHPVILDALRQLVRHSELVLSGEYVAQRGTEDALPFEPDAPRAVLEWSGPAVLTNAVARYLATKHSADLSLLARHREPVRLDDVVILPLASLQARSSVWTKTFDWMLGRNFGPLGKRYDFVKHAHAATWWSQKMDKPSTT
ncbi:hypothetical protein ACM66B_006948 [Microbotryomycetes sp. NB124-2]